MKPCISYILKPKFKDVHELMAELEFISLTTPTIHTRIYHIVFFFHNCTLV